MKALELTNRHLLVTYSENNLILKSIRISHHMLSVCGILTELFLLPSLHSISACEQLLLPQLLTPLIHIFKNMLKIKCLCHEKVKNF